MDLDDHALVVSYDVEATVVNEFGQAMQTERKRHKKRCVACMAAHPRLCHDICFIATPRPTAFASSR